MSTARSHRTARSARRLACLDNIGARLARIVGLHLGITQVPLDLQQSGAVDVGIIQHFATSELKVEADYGYDLLGYFGYRMQRATPFVMFGYSGIKLDASVSLEGGSTHNVERAGDGTLNGWKLAAGMEFPFSDSFTTHVLFHTADYAAKRIKLPGAQIATDGTRRTDANGGAEIGARINGIQFGIAYSF